MRKLMELGFFILLLTALATPVLAKHSNNVATPPADGDSLNMERLETLNTLLELSPQQTEEVKEIINRNSEKVKALREAAQTTRKEVRTLLEAETLDEDRLRLLKHELADIRTDRLILKHSTRTDIESILTPRQLEKKDALRKIKKRKMGQHKRHKSFAHIDQM